MTGFSNKGLKYEAWLSTPGAIKKEVIRTYFDSPLRAIPGVDQGPLRGRVSAVTIEYEDDGDDLTYDYATHFGYDINGNNDVVAQEEPLLDSYGLASQRFKVIEYDFDFITGLINEVSYQKGENDQLLHRFQYDSDNRLTLVFTSRDGINWDQDATYEYYAHGLPKRMELGDDKVQGLDWAYSIAGWLKGVNSTSLVGHRDLGRDGVLGEVHQYIPQDQTGFSIGYFDGDYDPIGHDKSLFEAKRKQEVDGNGALIESGFYNGMIREVVSAVRPFMALDGGPMISNYSYDRLNRLVGQRVQFSSDAQSLGVWTPDLTGMNYATNYSYDPNGNLDTLIRYDQNGAQMDHLLYRYRDSQMPGVNNQLLHVNDLGVGDGSVDITDQGTFVLSDPSTWNYQYDEIGNLISDASEEIEEIKWTMYDKVSEVIRTPGSLKDDLKFEYGPQGNVRLRVKVPKDSNGNRLPQSDWTLTRYITDADGNVLTIYNMQIQAVASDYQVDIFVSEQGLYGGARLGVQRLNDIVARGSFSASIATDGSFTDVTAIGETATANLGSQYHDVDLLGAKEYELTNHLGSVLATVTDRLSEQQRQDYSNGDSFETTDANRTEKVGPIEPVSGQYMIGLSTPIGGGFPASAFGPTHLVHVQGGEIVTAKVQGYWTDLPDPAQNTSTTGLLKLCLVNREGQFMYINGQVEYLRDDLNDAGRGPDVWHELEIVYNVPDLNTVDGYSGEDLFVQIYQWNPSDKVAYFDDLVYTVEYPSGYVENTADVISAQNYYPYGMIMPRNDNLFAANQYRYGFGGKEQIEGWAASNGTHLDFGARVYDARLGRWFSVDPEHGRAPGISPYAFGFNSPVRFVDPAGAFPWDVVLDVVQASLDIAGMIPAVGNIADLVNAGIYAARGDMVGAAMSLAAAVPGAGLVAGAANIGRKAYKAGRAIAKKRIGKLIKKVEKAGGTVPDGIVKKQDDYIPDNGGHMLEEVPIEAPPKQVQRRAKLRKGTKEEVIRKAAEDAIPEGKGRRLVDPDGKPIPGDKVTKHPDTGEELYGDYDYGHKDGHEWVDYQNNPDNWSKTRKEVLDDQNDPNIYQLESQSGNRSKGGKVGAERKKQKEAEAMKKAEDKQDIQDLKAAQKEAKATAKSPPPTSSGNSGGVQTRIPSSTSGQQESSESPEEPNESSTLGGAKSIKRGWFGNRRLGK